MLSTTDAKFVATASCACQGVWMRRVLEKLDQHIDARFHFLRDLTRDGVIEQELYHTRKSCRYYDKTIEAGCIHKTT